MHARVALPVVADAGTCPTYNIPVRSRFLDITLPGMPARKAEALIEKAYQVCPYSKAVRNNVAVKLGLIET